MTTAVRMFPPVERLAWHARQFRWPAAAVAEIRPVTVPVPATDAANDVILLPDELADKHFAKEHFAAIMDMINN